MDNEILPLLRLLSVLAVEAPVQQGAHQERNPCMSYDHTQYLSNVETVTIPASVHQLRSLAVQAVLYLLEPATGRHRQAPGLVAACVYGPPDYTITVTFTRPITGYLYIHEHPDMQLERAANRIQAAFREP